MLGLKRTYVLIHPNLGYQHGVKKNIASEGICHALGFCFLKDLKEQSFSTYIQQKKNHRNIKHSNARKITKTYK